MTREEAIEMLRNNVCNSHHVYDNALPTIIEALETLIPELGESKDERIIKALQEYVKNRNWALNGPTQGEVLAWLEKQKERGPLTKEEEMTLQDIKLHLEDEGCPTKWKDLLHDIYCLPYEKQEDASKAIEAVDRIDKYIDEHLANAHDMKDSNPDKKYYRGWDDALGKMAGILQDVYSDEKQKEQKPTDNVSQLTVQGKGVYKICPRCKERMVRDDSKVYTSIPPQYGYYCPKCGAVEFDTVVYDSPVKEEQKSKQLGLENTLTSKLQEIISDWQATGANPYDCSDAIGGDVDAILDVIKREQKPAEKFRVGDMIISTKNPHLTYKILEVGHINELGNPEYKVEIFEDGKPGIMDKPHNIHYMECHKVDEWGKLIEQKPIIIQWTGKNLKEVIDFTGKSPRFGEWFKSWEEYENYVHTHNDILKLFCEDGSHYEVPMGAWIVKTPDGYNIPSRFRFIQKPAEWSEEDNKRYISIGTTLETSAVLSKEDYDANMAWLRELVNAKKYSGPRPSWKPSEEKYDGNMDKECIKLCDILNSIPSIDTFESCCGHLKDRYSIWFFCNDIITTSRLGRCVERNYSDGKWELLVDSTDTHPTGVFWLRSKVPFQSYEEMEKSVNELCNGIQYWFNAKFDSYFNARLKPSINIDQLKSLMLQYLQEAANEKDDSDIEADTDKWARKILGYNFEQKPAEWSEEDEEHKKSLLARLEGMCKKGATFTQTRFAVSEDMDWLKSLRPQQKWSQKDNEFADDAIACVTRCYEMYKDNKEFYQSLHYNTMDIKRWLINVRKRLTPHWKPSEEQLKALRNFSTGLFVGDGDCDALRSLYEDLQKQK